MLSASNTGTETHVSAIEIARLPSIARSIQDYTRLAPEAASKAGGQSIAGGLINAVTRSGTNRFRGSFYTFGRNESLVGDLDGDEFGDFTDYLLGFRLGGTVARNRAFFFINGELRRRSSPSIAGPADSDQPIRFGAGSAALQRIVDIARDRYGYDAGGFDPFSQHTRNEKFFGRLDVNLSTGHRLILRHNLVTGDLDDGLSRGRNIFTLTSNQFQRDNITQSSVVQLNSTFSSHLANEARVSYSRVRDSRSPLSASFPQVRIDLEEPGGAYLGEVRLGVERFSQANALDQDTFEFTNDLHLFNLTLRLRKGGGTSFLPGLFGSVAYVFQDAEDINSGRSSRAISNWQYNETDDPNGETTATSDFEVRHRILAAGSWKFDFSRGLATTISMFYEGSAGDPFSYMYADDVNGDGIRGNDLAYIPGSRSDVSAEVTDAEWMTIDAFLGSDPALHQARGGIVQRNATRSPWRNRLDLRLIQQIPSIGNQHFELTLDILNLTNLINSAWGHRRYVSFDAVGLFNFDGYDEQGRLDVDLRVRDANEDGTIDREDVFQSTNLSSRWQVQLGVRYTF